MKIGVVSDTHIPARDHSLPEELLAGLEGVDRIIHAGDILNLETLREFEKIAETVAVRGNMDFPEIRKALPEKVLLELAGCRILVTHGRGEPDFLGERLLKQFRNENPDIVVFGHSHRAVNERQGGVLLFNPGSPTDTLFSPYRSYGIIELGDKIEAQIIILD